MFFRLVTFISFFIFSVLALASRRGKEMHERLDSVMNVRYQQNPYDTSYVIRPEGKWTIRTRANVIGNSINARGTIKDTYSEAHLETQRKTTLSFDVSHLVLSASFTINLGALLGKKNDYEIDVNYYGNRFGVDASYQNSHTLSGNIERNGTFHLKEGDASMRVLNVAAYYAFNHKRFSYPAAFSQSYIQRRSAGSWLLGLSYQGGKIDNYAIASDSVPRLYLRANHLGIGGGYGYNFVRGRWLLHGSFVPTVIVFNQNKLMLNGERKSSRPVHANAIFNERFAVIYNFPSRHVKKVSTYFVGCTAVIYNSLFSDDIVTVNQNKWNVRTFIGMRL